MGKNSPAAKSSEIQVDGAQLVVPGYETGGQRADQAPMVMASGLLDTVNAVVGQAPMYFPFPAIILGIRVKIRVQAGTALAHVFVGTIATPAQFADQIQALADAAGVTYIATILNGGLINAGDVVCFGSDGGATATGSVDVTVIWAPRAP
jgi:hypothetical protein